MFCAPRDISYIPLLAILEVQITLLRVIGIVNKASERQTVQISG